MTSTSRHASVRHVLVPEAQGERAGASVVLDADKLAHLRKVLRLEWGCSILVLDGAGREFDAILEKSGERGIAKLMRVVRERPARPALELVIGLPKNATMDWIVEKAVECGATRVRPVVCARSVVVPGGDASELEQKYVRRWRRIMDSAQEQSEQLWRTEINVPVAWNDFIMSAGQLAPMPSLAFFSELRSELCVGGGSERDALDDLENRIRTAQGGPMRVFIGPEGGLASGERDGLKSLGYQPVSLGESVLRVETAVVTALALARVLNH